MKWRPAMVAILLAMVMNGAGCHRRRALSEIPLLPDATIDDYTVKVGSPAREANSHHWIEYGLTDGGTLRLYFLYRANDGRRTLSEADLVNEGGQTIKHLYDAPAPQPASQPTTSASAATEPQTASSSATPQSQPATQP